MLQPITSKVKPFIKVWDAINVTLRRKKCGAEEHLQTCTIPKHDFQKSLNSAYCLTTHTAQGRTFDQHYVIHEKEKMDCRLLSSTISRSRHSDYVHTSDVKIPSFASDPLICKNIKLSHSWITGCTLTNCQNT